MEVDKLYNAFCRLKDEKADDGLYRAIAISEELPHKIGCTSEGYPMFFIDSESRDRINDIKLERFKVLFDRDCSINDIEKNVSITHKYSIVFLHSTNPDIQKYFLEVVYLVLLRLPVRPSTEKLKQEISKVIELFTAPPKFSKEVVRGLWAELFVIDRSQDPSYLVRAWHVDTVDKYDFNDSVNKVEVKSTKGQERTHLFSIDQLHPNAGSDLLIASVFVNQAGIGNNIFDIADSIEKRVTDPELKAKLKEIVYKTIGPRIDDAAKLMFDYKFAVDTYRIYDYRDIPSIPLEAIPSQVSGVHFRSDLSEIDPVDMSTLSDKGKLFSSL